MGTLIMFKFMCAGALISPRHILTAGHCVTGPALVDSGPLRVARLGEYNLKSNPDCLKKKCALPHQQVKILKRHPHPNYKSYKKEHDIAIVELEQNVKITDYVQPICLPNNVEPKISYGKHYSIAGWGKTQSALSSDVMMKAEVPLLPNASCAKAYTMVNLTNLHDGQICAGGEEGIDSCRGDSGGPLMAKSVLATDCTLPNGQGGECIISIDCPGYSGILEQENLTINELKFLRLLQCGYELDDPAICCPASGKYNDTIITINTTSSVYREPYVQVEISDRISGSSVLPSLGDCGIQYYQPNRIVGGGMVTSLDEFPWMGLLQYSNQGALCGGALISKKHVLTAAHCVTEPLLTVLGRLSHVRVGEYDIITDPDCDLFSEECADPPQDLKVDKVFVHPDYRSDLKNKHNDIAVIKLSQEARYNYFVQPICLPVPELQNLDQVAGHSLYVAGWGLTEKSIPSPVKMKLKVPVVPSNSCERQYLNLKIQLTPNHMCAGGEVRKGTSSGDSGGPLMAYDKYSDQWFCVGVVSLGLKKFGNVGVPGVYTKVYDYMDWIRTVVQK